MRVPGQYYPDTQPESKDDAEVRRDSQRARWEAYKASELERGVIIDESGGKVTRTVKQEVTAQGKPSFMTEEEWQDYLFFKGDQDNGPKWVSEPDVSGQLLFNYYQDALNDAKEFKAAGGTARSYLDTETDKTKEITRQYHDFEDRASLLYDLMGEEQDFAMAADDQNVANWKAQRDLGMATSPGGYYTTPYQSMTMSEILRPSLPDYVRPDYRLNESVGLPGPQGFDDPDYSPYGLPMFANGTAPLPPNFWPWPPRR